MNERRVHIRSFGCQMNKLDTALVAAALKDAGYGLTDDVRDADVVLINTCSVREHAEERVFSHLGHLKHARKHRPNLVVGVIGCMAQRLGERLLEHESVDVVCGPTQIPQVARLVGEALRRHEKRIAVAAAVRRPDEPAGVALERFESAYGVDGIAEGALPGQAFVRVMRGCDNFCTYCIVPYVRGAEVCRPPQAITEQIRRLADEGTRHVTLLGQTVNSYRYESGERTWCLADLLEMAAGVEGIEWVKFVTSYPSKEFYDEILRVMASSEKVCAYLHMPAQSGSDRILRAMNRHYSAAEYLELLARAREIVPGVAVAGDFIVGFPGETEEDFQATAEMVRKAMYKNCFIFKYSPRPGTTADKRLQDTVGADVKQRRNVELLAVQEAVSDQWSRAFLGRTVRVLVEGLSKKSRLNPRDENDQPQLVGRTSTDAIVVFNGPPSRAGDFAEVQITRTAPLTLFGELRR
ncbi:MAG: tRNA (N6-isopentenyl adenosine(37)-C2)-methylthiotransferase MiaB [Sedimentisphaerales bacterium]|nr:tRNA (N6-isopentenyl adenosine(37)-C2)-methylthiotransferase MiaB [Sedimentisphaerales bacterium]